MKATVDIEQVVREVLKELQAAPSKNPVVSTKPYVVKTPVQSGPSSINNGELTLSMPLVTLADVYGKLSGVSRVLIGPKTVITPSVRDTLRQKNIEISRESAKSKPTGSVLRMVIVAARTKTDPKPLAGALHADGVEIHTHSFDCLLKSTDKLAAELAIENTLGLMLTPHTAAALCLANRMAGVRAISGCETNNLERDTKAVGANLLIVDPQRVGFHKLSRMAGEFCRNGIQPCPEVFKNRLM